MRTRKNTKRKFNRVLIFSAIIISFSLMGISYGYYQDRLTIMTRVELATINSVFNLCSDNSFNGNSQPNPFEVNLLDSSRTIEINGTFKTNHMIEEHVTFCIVNNSSISIEITPPSLPSTIVKNMKIDNSFKFDIPIKLQPNEIKKIRMDIHADKRELELPYTQTFVFNCTPWYESENTLTMIFNFKEEIQPEIMSTGVEALQNELDEPNTEPTEVKPTVDSQEEPLPESNSGIQQDLEEGNQDELENNPEEIKDGEDIEDDFMPEEQEQEQEGGNTDEEKENADNDNERITGEVLEGSTDNIEPNENVEENEE